MPKELRFSRNPTPMPPAAVHACADLIEQIASSGRGAWSAYETVKGCFGNSGTSTSESWAQSDMSTAMLDKAANDALFVEAMHSALVALEQDGYETPPWSTLNGLLEEHSVGYFVDPPNLRPVVRTATEKAGGTIPPAADASLYKIGERLGAGAYGEVFRVSRNSAFGAFEFAMKIHSPHPFTQPDKARNRFAREVSALQRMQHRGIVQYLDAGVLPDGRPFLVMPLIVGQNLRDATDPEDFQLALARMTAVVEAVGYAHRNQVLHRDLKPANILVRESDGQPIVLDFGLAYRFDDATAETLTSMAPGTGAYVPHEVIMNPRDRTPLHDIYSCGVITYELLARKCPDPRNYSPLTEIHPRLAPVDEVVERALAPAKTRYPDAQTLRDALVRAAKRVSTG